MKPMLIPLALAIICAGCARPPATPDPSIMQTAIAVGVQATLTAAVPPPTAVPTDTPERTQTPSPRSTRSPMPTPTSTATPVPTARPTVLRSTATAVQYIYARAVGHAFEKWGRPTGMDRQDGSCGPFDNSRPMTALIINLVIENRGQTDMTDWYADFFDAAGTRLFTCYYIYKGKAPFPSIPAGKSVEVSFLTFMDDPYTAVHGYVYDRDLGHSNDLSFTRD